MSSPGTRWGTGTDVPAPAYVLPFALVASLILGNTGGRDQRGWMLLAFPIAALGRLAPAPRSWGRLRRSRRASPGWLRSGGV